MKIIKTKAAFLKFVKELPADIPIMLYPVKEGPAIMRSGDKTLAYFNWEIIVQLKADKSVYYYPCYMVDRIKLN